MTCITHLISLVKNYTQENKQKETEYWYNDNGNPTSISYGNNLKTTSVYTPGNQIRTKYISLSSDPTGANAIYREESTYRLDGNLVGREYTLNGQMET